MAVGVILLIPICAHAWQDLPGDLVEQSETPLSANDIGGEGRWISLRRMLAEGGELPQAGESARSLSHDERSARNRELREAMRSAYGERPGGVMRSGFPRR